MSSGSHTSGASSRSQLNPPETARVRMRDAPPDRVRGRWAPTGRCWVLQRLPEDNGKRRKLMSDAAERFRMSDTAEESSGERLLQEAKTGALRERMREHLSVHDSPDEFKQLRSEVTMGKDLSTTVVEDRNGRV